MLRVFGPCQTSKMERLAKILEAKSHSLFLQNTPFHQILNPLFSTQILNPNSLTPGIKGLKPPVKTKLSLSLISHSL